MKTKLSLLLILPIFISALILPSYAKKIQLEEANEPRSVKTILTIPIDKEKVILTGHIEKPVAGDPENCYYYFNDGTGTMVIKVRPNAQKALPDTFNLEDCKTTIKIYGEIVVEKNEPTVIKVSHIEVPPFNQKPLSIDALLKNFTSGKREQNQSMIMLEGYIDHFEGDNENFVLNDETGKILVYVDNDYTPNLSRFKAGDPVKVTGRVKTKKMSNARIHSHPVIITHTISPR